MAQRQWRSDDTSKWVYGFGNGSDGAYAPTTSTDAPIDSACTGTSGSNSLSATNASFASGQLILIHQTKGTGSGAWELNRISSYTTGTITTAHTLTNTYGAGAQVLVMKQYLSALVDTGVTLTGKAYNGMVGGIVGWFCKGTTTIAGTISVDGITSQGYESGQGGLGIGFHGGTGVYQGYGSNAYSYQGYGGPGAGAQSTSANGNGGGGGWGQTGNPNNGSGGGGANANAGVNGETTGDTGHGGGAGGEIAGTAALTNMVFGGGGGGGCVMDANSQNPWMGGGGGAGIVIIISKAITITGNISLDGGSGNGYNSLAGGGGGGGGSCLLKGKTLILGSSLITANGGGGGNGERSDGGAGGIGRIHADYSVSVTGTTDPALNSTEDATILDASVGGSFLYNIL